MVESGDFLGVSIKGKGVFDQGMQDTEYPDISCLNLYEIRTLLPD
jgi:hypothetical protein